MPTDSSVLHRRASFSTRWAASSKAAKALQSCIRPLLLSSAFQPGRDPYRHRPCKAAIQSADSADSHSSMGSPKGKQPPCKQPPSQTPCATSIDSCRIFRLAASLKAPELAKHATTPPNRAYLIPTILARFTQIIPVVVQSPPLPRALRRNKSRSISGITTTLCAIITTPNETWASSSAGRAPRSQRGGRRFDPGLVHQILQFTYIVFRNCKSHPTVRVGNLMPVHFPPRRNSV